MSVNKLSRSTNNRVRRIVLVEFKNWMTERGIRQKEIAAELDISPAFLSQIMYGDSPMPTEKIQTLWDKFRVPKRYFLRAA